MNVSVLITDDFLDFWDIRLHSEGLDGIGGACCMLPLYMMTVAMPP
jgi:hypothetical protein